MDIREQKYFADAMLGRLARWLRILGYDVAFLPQIDDDDLEEMVLASDAILLTRDTRLVLRRSLRRRSILVTSNDVGKQLREVVPQLSGSPNPYTRCPVCNGVLQSVDRGRIRHLVPPYVWRTHKEFAKCSKCGHIYWRGSHTKRANAVIRELIQLWLASNRKENPDSCT